MLPSVPVCALAELVDWHCAAAMAHALALANAAQRMRLLAADVVDASVHAGIPIYDCTITSRHFVGALHLL